MSSGAYVVAFEKKLISSQICQLNGNLVLHFGGFYRGMLTVTLVNVVEKLAFGRLKGSKVYVFDRQFGCM